MTTHPHQMSPFYKMTRHGKLSYTSNLASGLNQLRQEGSLCDITIIVANQRFQAHKAVLSASSDYFRSMFTSGFQESICSEVFLEGNAEAFAQLLDFAYTGFFRLSPAYAWSILKMANYMNFDLAVGLCKKYLLQHVQDISREEAADIICFGEIQDDLSHLVQDLQVRLVHDFSHFFEIKTILEHATKEFIIGCLEDEGIETDENTEERVRFSVSLDYRYKSFILLPN